MEIGQGTEQSNWPSQSSFFLGYKGKIKALCFTELANNHDGQSDFSYDYVPNQYWQAESAIHELKALSR